MRGLKSRIKFFTALTFTIASIFLWSNSSKVTSVGDAFSAGPPAGFSGAPGEQTCTACHFGGPSGGGTFTIDAPQTYVPGQTYQVLVRHVNQTDATRRRWGFQLTALAGTTTAGSFATLNQATQIVGGIQRDYIEHTTEGTFAGQQGGAQWGFNWTAPATDVGTVTFYAAGNQANNNGGADGDTIYTATATSQPMQVPTAHAPFDFDGDGKTDIGIYRPGPSEWWINRSSTGQTFAAQFGAPGDIITPGDYTGDGKADVALFRPSDGSWLVLRSEDFSFFGFPFGASGDIPVPANYDGDSKTDPAVFRPSSTLWFIARSSGGTDIVQFGLNGDNPMPADYDGDGKADIAVRRQNGGNSEWWVSRTTAGPLALVFGADTDIGVPGDYTGDGKTDIAFFRPSNGFWFVLRSEDFSFYAVPFGATGDIPSPGDYDGDGKWDIAVFRPSDTNWFIDRTTAGIRIVQFGSTGDRPLPNAFVR